MSGEDNKRIVREFLRASAWHDGDTFERLLAQDATYWVQGLPHQFRHGGLQTREQICRYMHTPTIFTGGIEQRVGAMTAEDDRVAAEVEFTGVLADGRVYRCTYHYLIVVRDGQVASVKEYLDTAAAIEFFS